MNGHLYSQMASHMPGELVSSSANGQPAAVQQFRCPGPTDSQTRAAGTGGGPRAVQSPSGNLSALPACGGQRCDRPALSTCLNYVLSKVLSKVLITSASASTAPRLQQIDEELRGVCPAGSNANVKCRLFRWCVSGGVSAVSEKVRLGDAEQQGGSCVPEWIVGNEPSVHA